MSRVAINNDEQILVDVRPHAKVLSRPVIVLFSLCFTGGLLAGITYGCSLGNTFQNYIVDAIAISAILIGIKTIIIPIISWFSTRFMVTDRRIIFNRGIIKKSGIDIPLGYISRLTYQQKIIEKLFAVGSLIIESYEEDAIFLTDVPKIKKIQYIINNELDREQ